jgi:hypothetical protein
VKILIAFVGIVILALFCLSFQSDMNNMLSARYRLQDVAEESALGAVIIMNKNNVTAQDESVDRFVTDALASGLTGTPFGAGSEPGYRFVLTQNAGTLTIAVSADVKNFFRIPIFSVNELYASVSVPLEG